MREVKPVSGLPRGTFFVTSLTGRVGTVVNPEGPDGGVIVRLHGVREDQAGFFVGSTPDSGIRELHPDVRVQVAS